MLLVVALTNINTWYRFRGEPPRNLTYLINCINRGIVPPELSLMIPREYEKSEAHTMSASLNRTFGFRGGRPMWCVDLKLCDGGVLTETSVLFDSNGDIYQ
jgi:hypothetical protein